MESSEKRQKQSIISVVVKGKKVERWRMPCDKIAELRKKVFRVWKLSTLICWKRDACAVKTENAISGSFFVGFVFLNLCVDYLFRVFIIVCLFFYWFGCRSHVLTAQHVYTYDFKISCKKQIIKSSDLCFVYLSICAKSTLKHAHRIWTPLYAGCLFACSHWVHFQKRVKKNVICLFYNRD